MNTGAYLIIKKRFSVFLNLSSFIIISSSALRLGSWFFIRLTYFMLFYILIMVPRTPFKKALSKYSRVVLIKLARKIYLRYSKRVSVNLTHRYKYKDF
jgi:Na+-transporting NADH:ubiquinone oxidoreductase subunit NqrB